MKFYNYDGYYDNDIHHISDMILVPFEESIDYRDYYTSERMWTKFQYDLNGILYGQLSKQLDRVTGISIKAAVPYFIDYIKMTEEGKEDQVIDDFDYPDSPLNHGWGSDAYFDFASVQDPYLGCSCIIISPVTFVEVNQGDHLNDIDFALRLSGSIAGRVTGAEDGLPVPGIRLAAASDQIGYGYPYYYGKGCQ